MGTGICLRRFLRTKFMDYKRILTVQDISCVGQCSLTVALPILSACGVETCILPSAVLSTHTAGFSGYTVRDLAEDILPITRHWEKENIEFDAVYTGLLYLRYFMIFTIANVREVKVYAARAMVVISS